MYVRIVYNTYNAALNNELNSDCTVFPLGIEIFTVQPHYRQIWGKGVIGNKSVVGCALGSELGGHDESLEDLGDITVGHGVSSWSERWCC